MRIHKRFASRAWMILVLAVCLLWTVGSGSVSAQVEDDVCLTCHEDYDAMLNRTAHRLSSSQTSSAVEIACISCHRGGEAHVDEPAVDNIGNPGRMGKLGNNMACTGCHQPHMNLDQTGVDPHAEQDMNCSSCHRVHSDYSGLLVDEEADFCGACHTAVTNQFRKRSNHPLTSQNLTCISCHDFTGENQPMFGHGASSNCADCHMDFVGPYLFEHEAVSSFSVEGSGCNSCHQPHGSFNERLLNQPGNGLCRQCHGIPPGHLTVHNGIGNQYNCIECHSEIHGSNDNRDFLDPNLSAKIGGDGCSCHLPNE